MIRFLDLDPTMAAAYYCDTHVAAGLVEMGQALTNAHRLIDGVYRPDFRRGATRWMLRGSVDTILPEVVNEGDPVGEWVRSEWTHYEWGRAHFAALATQHRLRFGAAHEMEGLLSVFGRAPEGIARSERVFKTPPLCLDGMEEVCRVSDADNSERMNHVVSHRMHYLMTLGDAACWSNVERPYWWPTTRTRKRRAT